MFYKNNRIDWVTLDSSSRFLILELSYSQLFIWFEKVHFSLSFFPTSISIFASSIWLFCPLLAAMLIETSFSSLSLPDGIWWIIHEFETSNSLLRKKVLIHRPSPPPALYSFSIKVFPLLTVFFSISFIFSISKSSSSVFTLKSLPSTSTHWTRHVIPSWLDLCWCNVEKSKHRTSNEH